MCLGRHEWLHTADILKREITDHAPWYSGFRWYNLDGPRKFRLSSEAGKSARTNYRRRVFTQSHRQAHDWQCSQEHQNSSGALQSGVFLSHRLSNQHVEQPGRANLLGCSWQRKRTPGAILERFDSGGSAMSAVSWNPGLRSERHRVTFVSSSAAPSGYWEGGRWYEIVRHRSWTCDHIRGTTYARDISAGRTERRGSPHDSRSPSSGSRPCVGHAKFGCSLSPSTSRFQ